MRTLVLVPALAVLAVLAVPAVARAADSHPFNVRDMQAMDRVAEPTVSPDGKLVVFTESLVTQAYLRDLLIGATFVGRGFSGGI